MKRVSRKSFLDKNYYAMSCYSSSRYNTFSELSAANLQVAWFFVILIFSPNKGMKCFRSSTVETKIISQTLATKNISGSLLHL